uniref:Protein SPT2-like protein n=1 Tax=Noccaea caerulescens TaxID=107243 RepID=A0A1J3I899_NOCCA
MQGYEEDLDEEAGYDDYYSDDDGLEQDEYEYEDEEEEGEDEDERPPSKEEMEYLELRQKLKDSIRKNMGKGSANAQSSQERRRKLPYNDFGSFFGPSRPVISSRVIQESKSLLENEIRTARTPSSSNQMKKRPVPTSNSSSKNASNEKRPKVVNEVRRKVQALKDTRDYSFLLSDDAELPLPKKEPLSRSGSFPSSEARSAQPSARPKQSSGINGGRPAQGGPPREERRPVSANGRPVSSGGQMNHSRSAPSGSQMQNSRPASSGSQLNHSRPVSGRPASSGSQMQNSRPASSGSQMQQRAVSSASQKPGSSANRQAPMRPPGSVVNGQSANRNGQPNSRLDSQRSAPAKAPMDHRKPMSSSSNGVGPARSASTGRPLPSKPSLDRKPSMSTGKSSLQSAQRPSSSRPMSSDPRQRMVEQRKVSRDPATSRMIPKQSAPTSKQQMMSRPVPKRPPSRDIDDDRRPLKKKKKPARMSEDELAVSMVREMFNTHRFAGRDDDDRNMEAGYEDIQKEERRSARIAKEEDERERLLEEEEERRERQRKARRLGR